MACHSLSAPLSTCEVKRNQGGEKEKKAEARNKQRERWGRNRRVGKEGGNSQKQGDPRKCCWRRVPSLAPRTLPGQCAPKSSMQHNTSVPRPESLSCCGVPTSACKTGILGLAACTGNTGSFDELESFVPDALVRRVGGGNQARVSTSTATHASWLGEPCLPMNACIGLY